MTDLGLGGEKRTSYNQSELDILKNPNLNKILEAALAFHGKGNVIKAEEYYKVLLGKGCKHPSLFINYGILCQRSSRKAKAIELYKKAIAFYPDIPESYLNIGSILRVQGKLKEAENYILKVIEMNPKNFSANLNLGNIMLDQGNLIKAEKFTRQALQLNPNNIRAHTNLSLILSMQGKFKESIDILITSIVQKPKDNNLKINLINELTNYSPIDHNIHPIVLANYQIRKSFLTFGTNVRIKKIKTTLGFSFHQLGFKNSKYKIVEPNFVFSILKNLEHLPLKIFLDFVFNENISDLELFLGGNFKTSPFKTDLPIFNADIENQDLGGLDQLSTDQSRLRRP